MQIIRYIDNEQVVILRDKQTCVIIEAYTSSHHSMKTAQNFKIVEYDDTIFEFYAMGSYNFVLINTETNQLIKIPRLKLLLGRHAELVELNEAKQEIRTSQELAHNTQKYCDAWRQIHSQEDYSSARLISPDTLNPKSNNHVDLAESIDLSPYQAAITAKYTALQFISVPLVDGYSYTQCVSSHRIDASIIDDAICDEILRIYAETGLIVYDGHAKNFIYRYTNDSENPVKAICIDLDCAIDFCQPASLCDFNADMTKTALTLRILSDVIAGQDKQLISSLRLSSVRKAFIKACNEISMLVMNQGFINLNYKDISFIAQYTQCVLPTLKEGYIHVFNGLGQDTIFNYQAISTYKYKKINFHPIMKIELNILNYLKERGGRQILCGQTTCLSQISWFKRSEKVSNLSKVLDVIKQIEDTPLGYKQLLAELNRALEADHKGCLSHRCANMLNENIAWLQEVLASTQSESLSTHANC